MGTVSWKHNSDGNWSVAGNWSGGALPGAADDVVLSSLSHHTVIHNVGTDTIHSLTATTDSLSLTGGTLSVLGTTSLGQNLTMAGGTLSLGGSASLAGTLAGSTGELVIGSTLAAVGTLNFGLNTYGNGLAVDGSGTLATAGTVNVLQQYYSFYSALVLGGVSWSNTGTVNDAGAIYTGDGAALTASLTNAAGAVFDITGDGGDIYNGSGRDASGNTVSGSSVFADAGLFEKTGGTAASTVASLFTSTGTVLVAGGTLDFVGGGLFGGTLEGAGALAFGGGAATLASGVQLSVASLQVQGGTLALSKGVNYAGAAAVSGGTLAVSQAATLASFVQTGGTVAVTGAVLNLGSATLAAGQIDGLGTVALGGATSIGDTEGDSFGLGGGITLLNTGTATQLNDLVVESGTGMGFTVSNVAGATYDVAGDYEVGLDDGPLAVFANAGLFAKTAGTFATTVAGTFNNTGTIQIDSGTIDFAGGGSFGGTVTGGGTLAFNGGVATLAGTLAAPGGGVLLQGGTLALGANQNFASGVFTQSGGSLLLAGKTLTLTDATLGNGVLEGPGTLSTFGATIEGGGNGSGTLTLGSGLAWVNAGTVTETNSLYLDYAPPGGFAISNLAGATWDVANNATVGAYNGYDGHTGSFNNAGTFAQVAGAGTTDVAIAFTSTGSIAVATGVLQFDGGGSFGGTVGGAGTLSFNGGTATLSAMLQGLGGLRLNGGSLVLGRNDTLGAGKYVQYGGALYMGGTTFTVAGGYFGAGAIEGSGTLATSGATTVAGYQTTSSVSIGSGLIWNNTGTVSQNWELYVDYGSLAGFTLNNATGAVYDITGDNGFGDNNGANGVTASIVNAGTFAKSGGTGLSEVHTFIASTGSIGIASGTLQFDAGGSFGGTIGGAGRVVFAGGTATIQTALSGVAGGVALAGGTMALTANLTLGSGSFVQTGGTIDLDGDKLSVVGGSFGNGLIEGAGTLVLSGTTALGVGGSEGAGGNAVITNTGTVSQASDFYIDYNSGSGFSFTNSAGATYDLTVDDTFGDYEGYNGVAGSFSNAGTFAKTGGTNTSYVRTSFSNTGTVNVATGTVEFDSGGTLGGTLTGVGTVALAGGSFTLGATITGLGSLLLDGASVTLGGNLATAAGQLSEVFGTVFLAGDTLSTNGFYFGNGAIEGPGTVTTAGTATFGGYQNYYSVSLGGGVALSNSGTINQLRDLYVDYGSGAGFALTNKAGATYDVVGDYTVGVNDGANGVQASFANAGTFAKTAGTGVTYVRTSFANTGTVALGGGTIEFDSGGSFAGKVTGTGLIDFAYGSYTLGGLGFAATAAAQFYNSTVTLTAGQTIASPLTMIGSTVNLGGFGLALSAGLSVPQAGSGATFDGGGTVTLGGTSSIADWYYNGVMFVAGAGATVTNTGTLLDGGLVQLGNATAANGVFSGTIVNQAGAVFDFTSDDAHIQVGVHYDGYGNQISSGGTFVNAGLVAKTGGTAASTIDAVFDSTGTISAITGTIVLDGGGALSGLVADASDLVLSAGTYADGALTLGSGGTIVLGGVVDATGALSLGDGGAGTLSLVNSGLYKLDGNVGITGSGALAFSNTGTIEKIAGAGKSTIAASFANSGTVMAEVGTLALSGTVSGTGSLVIGAGSVLELGAKVAATQSVYFTGGGETLLLDQAASAGETINGLGLGDVIDLAGITATKAVVNGADQLVVSNGSKTVATLQLTGSQQGDSFTIASDGSGGTKLTVAKKATAWNGANGDWYANGVWNNGAPDAGTDATISAAGTYTASLGYGETGSVHSLTQAGTAATTVVYGTLDVAGTLALQAGSLLLYGTIDGGVLAPTGGALGYEGGLLQDVAFRGTLDLSADNSRLAVGGAFSLAGVGGSGAGTVKVTGAGSTLYADNVVSLDNATLTLGNNSSTAAVQGVDTNGLGALLTLGSALSLVQGGTFALLADGGNAVDALDSQGTITAGIAGGTFVVAGANFENDGTIKVTNGDEFSIRSGDFANTGTLSVVGSTLDILGTYEEFGTTTAKSSTLNFGGPLTLTELNAIDAPGGNKLNLTGTLALGGGTLAIGGGASLTALTLSGDLVGGTVSAAAGGLTLLNGATLDAIADTGTITVGNGVAVTLDDTLKGTTIIDNGSGILFGAGVTLDGVRYRGTISVLDGTTLSVTDGITLSGTAGSGNGAISVAAGTVGSALRLLDNETLAKVAITSGVGGGGTQGLYLGPASTGGTLTLASSASLHILGGTAAGFRAVGAGGQSLNGVIVNDGVISIDAGATFLGSDASIASFTNAGTVSLGTGALWIAGTPAAGAVFANAAGGLVTVGSLAVLTTNAGGMSNAGTVSVAAGGAVSVQGAFSQTGTTTVGAGGIFAIHGSTTLSDIAAIGGAGTLGIDGLLNLGGAIFDMAASGRITNVSIGGDVRTGTIANDAGTLGFNGSATLDAVTWLGPLNIGNAASVLAINGVVVESAAGGTPGVVNLSAGGSVDFAAAGTLDQLTVNSASGTATDGLQMGSATGTLTLGAHFTLNAGMGSLVLADVAAAAAGTLVNRGQVNVTGGALLIDSSFATVINASTITLANNTEFASPAGESGATSFSNTGLVSAGSLVAFDVLGSITNSGTIRLGNGSEMSAGGAVSNAGSITLGNGGSLIAAGTLANTGSIFAKGATSDFVGGAAAAGSAFNNGTLSGGYWNIAAASTLTLEFGAALTTDAATIVLAGSGAVLRSVGTAIARVENTLASIAATGTLSVLGGRGYSTTLAFSDAGVVQLQGGTLATGGLTLAGHGTVVGSGTVAGGVANGGLMEANGGTLTLSGAVTGGGSLQIDAAAVLELAQANAETVTWAAGSGTLQLDAPASYTGVLAGFASGDSVLLVGTNATAAKLAGRVLTVTLSGGGTETFATATSYAATTLTTASDGKGDTLITYPAAGKPATPAQDLAAARLAAGVAMQQAIAPAAPVPVMVAGTLAAASAIWVPHLAHLSHELLIGAHS